jgi:formylglycine-generating enzyme required for sulfatase activity
MTTILLRRQLLGLAALILLASACSDDECAECPTQDAAIGQPDTVSLCQKDQVQCAADEINAFGICMAQSSMVKVAGGEFTMGKTETGKPYSPEHKVNLKEFLIDVTEVTVAQYKACVDCGVCKRPLRDGSHTGREPYYGNDKYKKYPVIYVTWQDAKAYCEGIGKRLPTEAEWEKAARGTSAGEYPWGTAAPTKEHANFGGLVNDTSPVSDFTKGKSPSGALNMAGNVWEWVNDSYDAGYYAKSPASDPPGPEATVLKVVRGGCFNSEVDMIKTFAREPYVETAAFSFIGFRCAKDKW